MTHKTHFAMLGVEANTSSLTHLMYLFVSLTDKGRLSDRHGYKKRKLIAVVAIIDNSDRHRDVHF